MNYLIILFILLLLLVIFIVYKLINYKFFYIKRLSSLNPQVKDLALPSPVINYILTNLSLKRQIKISQCSRSMLNRIRRIRDCDADILKIDGLLNKRFSITRKKHYITVFGTVENILQLKRRISVKSELTFSFVKANDINKILKKIDYSKMGFNNRMSNNRNYYYPALIFEYCQINRNIFIKLSTIHLYSLIIKELPIFEHEFDILHYAFTYFKHLKKITVPWQTQNITTNHLLSDAKHAAKFYSFKITNIHEIINPEIFVKFAKNNMETDGIFSLAFLEPFILESYANELELFLKNKIANDFKCDCWTSCYNPNSYEWKTLKPQRWILRNLLFGTTRKAYRNIYEKFKN